MKKLIFLIGILLSFNTFSKDSIRLIISAGTGGLQHRYIVELLPFLTAELNTDIILDFKPGAEGYNGAVALLNDTSGKLVLLFDEHHIWNIQPPISQITDMILVSYIGANPGLIFSKPNNNFINFKEAIAYSKRIPLTYGVAFSNTNAELLRKIAIIYSSEQNLIEVRYKSGAQITTDVAGGHIDIGVTTVAKPLIDSGILIPLATIFTQRSQQFLSTPTLYELDIKISNEHKYYSNLFLWANKNANPFIIKKLRRAISKYLLSAESADMRNRLNLYTTAQKLDSPEQYLKELLIKE